jgi:ribosome maturation factor RimP
VSIRYREAKSGAETERDGLLLERSDTDVHLNVRGRTVRIPRSDVISVRLVTASEG